MNVSQSKEVGYKNLKRNSQYRSEVVTVSRRLYGAEVIWWEQFFRVVAKGGKSWFWDDIAGTSGIETKLVKVLNGYTIRGDLQSYILNCELEVKNGSYI